jgi:Protein of unknown function (DUF4232)
MTPAISAARRVIAAVTLAGIGTLAAACGSSGHPRATVTVTKTAPAKAGSSSPAATPSASPAAAAACAPSSLRLTLGLAQGTAGSVYQAIDFTNTSSTTCTLYGYPGVSFVTKAGGSQIGSAAERSTASAARLVTLAPGATGNALLQVVDAGNFSPSACDPVNVKWLKVYPPGAFSALYLRLKTQTCAKRATAVRTLRIGVVLPGSGGGG